jgi:hypothetical protein
MAEVHLAEASEVHEALTEEGFNRLLNGVGNHEAKLLTTAVIGSQPERWFTRNGLHSELIGCQGNNVAWRVSSTLPGNYCDYSLEPIGAVVASKIEGKRGPVHAFHSTEFGETWGLAFAGGLLDWSLRHPDVSLQKLLGNTNSATGVRSPETRLQLFTELLTNPDNEVSFTDVTRSISDDRFSLPNINKHFHDLESLGIVSITTTMQDFNPVLEVSDPTYRHLSISLEEASIGTRTVYKAIEQLYGTEEKEVTLERLLELCQEIEPDVDIQPIYRQLVKATSDKSFRYPGLTLTDRNGAPIKRNSVKIEPANVEAIEDLLQTLENLQNPQSRQAFIDKANNILSNSDACSALMEKAQRFSAVYAGSVEGFEVTNQRLINIIRELGSVTALEVRDELSNRGRSLNRATVMRLLGNLAHEGKISAVEEQLDPRKRNKIKRYSVPEPQ